LKCNFSNITDRFYTITGLTEDLNYEFRVYAKNAAGSTSEASEVTCPICCVDCYIAPKLDLDRNIKDTVIARAGDTIKLGADIVGKPAPTIDWKLNKRIIESDNHYIIESSETRTVLEIKDLTREDTGKYELELTNCAGTKAITINLKVHDTPAAPVGPIDITSVYADRVTMVWKQPSNDGCSLITNYVVERRETSRLAWTVVAPCVETLSHRVTGLLEGHEYLFRVRAENKYGTGKALETIAVVAKNPFVEPGAPSRPTVTNVTKSGAMVTWTPPKDDGGRPVKGYHIEKKFRESAKWFRATKKLCMTHSFRVTNLIETRQYEFRIIAENAAGLGHASEASLAVAIEDPTYTPGVPTLAKVLDSSQTCITVGWSKAAYDGGSHITGYHVEMAEVPEDEELELEYTEVTSPKGSMDFKIRVKELEPGKFYRFRFASSNVNGKSDWKDLQQAVEATDRFTAPSMGPTSQFKKSLTIKAGLKF
jgi:titin